MTNILIDNNYYLQYFPITNCGMKTDTPTLSQKLEHFETACRAAGLKVTPQRYAIFRELASAGDHPTAETLYKRLHKTMPALSLDTVYRTLTTFEKHGLISRVQTTESHARFEAEMERHHHAICSRCHSITDFHWDICETSKLPGQIAQWGNIRNRQITLHGICAQCAEAENR